MFQLHSQLAVDTIPIGQFTLSLVLLHKDANFPWLILVPKREAINEIHHLSELDQQQLMRESSHLSEVMTSIYAPKTMNIAALGNMVSQLHVHHIARFEDDLAWPGPIWGAAPAKAYEAELLKKRREQLLSSLVGEGFKASNKVAETSASSAGFTP